MQEMQEMWVQSLGSEDSLEKEMSTHSSILAWENSMSRGAWWTIVRGITKSQTQLKQQSTVQHEIIRKDLTFTILDS